MKNLLVFCFVLVVVAADRGARHSPLGLRKHAAASTKVLPDAVLRKPTTVRPQGVEQDHSDFADWINNVNPSISEHGGKPAPPAYLTRKLQLALAGLLGKAAGAGPGVPRNRNAGKRVADKTNRKNIGAKKRALARGPSDLYGPNDWYVEGDCDAPSMSELLESLTSCEGQLSDAFYQYARDHSPEEAQAMIVNIGIGAIANWNVPTARKLEREGLDREDASFLQNLTGLIKFLAVLSDYFQQCSGREQECVKELAEVMTQLQENQTAGAHHTKRRNSEQNLILDAVKELAEKLETSSDPNDEALLALAHALLKLHDDLEQHIAEHEHSVQNNVIVILAVYDVLLTIDNCHQDNTCVNDLYNACGYY